MKELATNLLRFSKRVLLRFHRGKGLLFASAVAFNALLSGVPLVGLVLVILSNFVETRVLLAVIDRQLAMAVPQSAPHIAEAITSFTEGRALASTVGAVVTIFFSAIAFRTLDDALSAIFKSTRPHKRRHPVLSLVLPLIFMGLVVLVMVLLSLLVTAADMLPDSGQSLLGFTLSSAFKRGISMLSVIALVGLFASFYRIMPEADVPLRNALVGGLVAASLWELLRRLLSYYFANVSLVGVIYGSLTTVIVLLFTFEAAALIVLLGGQVIAELLRSSQAGLPWHEEPDDD
jgi:YihY family inner membrane protein